MQNLAPYLRTRGDGDLFLESYAFPGGYPMYYLDGNSDVLCPQCATKDLFSAWETGQPVGVDIHLEGPPLTCDNCGIEIPSAYGDPDQEGEE